MPQGPQFWAEIAARLAEVVETRFTNQREAARVAGISKSTLQRYVAGSTGFDLEAVVVLGVAAGVSLDWLIFGEEPVVSGRVAGGGGLSATAVRDAAGFVLRAAQAFPNLSHEQLVDAIIVRAGKLDADATDLTHTDGMIRNKSR